MLTLIVVKIIDNIILACKSIATYHNKKYISSLLVVISQMILYTIIKQIMLDDSFKTILCVSLAAGFGNYLAFIISDYFKADDKWTFNLTSSNRDDVIKLCGYLVEHNIKYLANYGLNRKGKDTINVIAFSKTKDQSRLIEQYLHSSKSQYLKEINR